MTADLDEVRRLVLRGLQGYTAQVYLFGSQARGDAWEGSDIDVGVLPAEPLPIGVLGLIREALEDSTIASEVDLIDLSETGAAFRERVLHEGVLWNG